MESRMPRTQVPVSLITPYYRVTGMVAVTAAGLVGLANDLTDSYIEMENASLVRLHRPQETVAQFPVWSVVKSRIVAVLLETRGDLGRISVARAGYTRQIAYRVWAAIHGFEIFGVIESPGKFDFSSQMFQGNRQFVPLFNATIIPVLFPQLVSRSPALLFNRQMVEGMGVLSEVDDKSVVEEKKTPTGRFGGGSTGQFPRSGGSTGPFSGGAGSNEDVV
jgi:hypothetical protein